mmetsp:Transcript_35505/g.59845  ORF Transcript_35505/g.59845 Transcript_35505/m.59845 type:complete len:207 (+) Transcript_35505:661-1281(+)
MHRVECLHVLLLIAERGLVDGAPLLLHGGQHQPGARRGRLGFPRQQLGGVEQLVVPGVRVRLPEVPEREHTAAAAFRAVGFGRFGGRRRFGLLRLLGSIVRLDVIQQSCLLGGGDHAHGRALACRVRRCPHLAEIRAEVTRSAPSFGLSVVVILRRLVSFRTVRASRICFRTFRFTFRHRQVISFRGCVSITARVVQEKGSPRRRL